MYDKEQEAISFIKRVYHVFGGEFYAGNSGGKDSAVLDHLLQRAGIPYQSYHTNTTMDPPGTLRYIRTNYPHTQIMNPKKTFLQLVEDRSLPTRLARYCCGELKEYASIGKQVFLGVRRAESRQRQGRSRIYYDTNKRHKGTIHFYPIYYWTDDEVWDYIDAHQIPIHPAYDQGLERVGCVGCPLAGVPKRKSEFEKYPKYYNNIRNAIERGMAKNPQWKLTVATDGDADIAMDWWMSNRTINEYFKDYEFYKQDGKWRKRYVPRLSNK